MVRLGISLYPDISKDLERDKAYVDMAAKYGFTRIFSNLISVGEDELKSFRELNSYAKERGFEIILDVVPSLFEEHGASATDLSFFKGLNADGIRLDLGYGGENEAAMTFNPEGLKIEINCSTNDSYIDSVASFRPYKDKLITCHNFYPQRHTGLGFDRFYTLSKKVKEHNFVVAAFIGTQEEGAFGPWPVNDGLCTLEMHRDLPMDLQARHLLATEVVDDILIANCYPTEEELKAVTSLHLGKVTIKIELSEGVSDVEKDIIYNYPHVVRADMSEYMARSTMPRIDYKEATIKPWNTNKQLKRGDVVILNEEFGRYKGELHVILQDMPNEGNINVVGRINEEERIMLDFLQPWRRFALI